MKRMMLVIAIMVQTINLPAAQMRVALLDTEDLASRNTDPVTGSLQSGAIARKGAPLIGKLILKNGIFNMIDRRDFTTRIDQHKRPDSTARSDNSPALQAARALRADAILKSAVLSLSAENRSINQGGYSTELKNLTIRVMIEILDCTDGAIIAMADGTASREFRATAADSTTIGEEEILQLFEVAVTKAIPEIEGVILKRMERNAEKSRTTVSIKTLADPAMVEIDGMLVGTTPMEKMEVYAGDHVISITKPGYQEISKRVLIQKDTTLTVPMLRNELTMEELKEISKDMSLNRIAVMQPAWIMETK